MNLSNADALIRHPSIVPIHPGELLAERLGTSSEFWMNLQVAYDLEEARGAACP